MIKFFQNFLHKKLSKITLVISLYTLMCSSLLAVDFAEDVYIGGDVIGNKVAIWVEMTDGVGIIQSAYRPFAGSWSSPVAISPSGMDSFEPDVITSDSGDTIVVWKLVDLTGPNRNTVIYSATLPSGGSWSAAGIVTSSTEDVRNFQLEMNNAGLVVVIWSSYFDKNVHAAISTFGGSWTSTQISSIP